MRRYGMNNIVRLHEHRSRRTATCGARRPGHFRRGLTFLEVLFAVIILGIGFIMLAAIFPVAIQQQQAALESAASTATMDSATATLRQVAGLDVGNTPKGPFLPEAVSPPVIVQSFNNNAWNLAIAGNVIDPANPHYAWAALYMRGTSGGAPDSTATVYLFTLASRNQPAFGAGDLTAPSGYFANVEPQGVTVTAVTPGGSPGTNTLKFAVDSNHHYEAACEGAYVVIADGSTVGKVYQLGSLVDPSDLTTWYISPAQDLASSDTASNPEKVTSNVNAWLLGKGYRTVNSDPSGTIGPVTTDGFAGNCQVIGFRKLSISIPTGY